MSSHGGRKKPHVSPEPATPGGTGPVRYRIELKPSAERDLAGLQRRDRVRVARKIDSLAGNPRPTGGEKLRGAENLWRVRVGDYRLIYTIRDEVLLLLVVRIQTSGV